MNTLNLAPFQTDPDEDKEFRDLIAALKNSLEGTPWTLLLYHWEIDADTGGKLPIGNNPWLNGTEAAESAHQHGRHLGRLLSARMPALQRAHFIAHSAGSWVARGAAKYLSQNLSCTSQVTLLDPFIPQAVAGISSNLSVARMEEIPDFAGAGGIWQAENYFSDDPTTAGTQEVFSWGDKGTNLRVGLEGLVVGYWGHSGPITFYTDTVRMSTGEEAIHPGKMAAVKMEQNFIGWNRSMYQREPLFLPTDHPRDRTALPGAEVSFFAEATLRFPSDVITYQWYKDGAVMADEGDRITGSRTTKLNIRTVQASDRGSYRLRATTYGFLFNESNAANLAVVAPGPNPPTAVVASAVSSSQINIVWSGEFPAGTSFRIEGRSANGAWSEIGIRNGIMNFLHIGLTPSTKYVYRVIAYNTSGISAPSLIVEAITLSTGGAFKTLAVLSQNPDAGAAIVLTTDANGKGDAFTPFSRTYAENRPVVLVAAATAGGKAFLKWQRNGVDDAVTKEVYLTMDHHHTMTAVYGSASPRALASITVNGPNTVNESSSQAYTATAAYTDGSSGPVVAQWRVTQAGSPATIVNGVLDAGAVSADTSVTIEASYTSGGVTKSGPKIVTILNSTAAQTYTLTVSSSGQGQVIRIPNQSSFAADAKVTLRANAVSGHRFTGWGGDATGTDSSVVVTMNADKNVTATFVHDPNYFGSVVVTLEPASARAAGARWRLDNEPWQISGASMKPDSNGSHTLFFSEVNGYATPALLPVNVVSGQSNAFSATYVSQLSPGALQVSLEPQAAVAAGAQWRPEGTTTWRDSNATLPGLAAGNYTIEFKSVTDWAAPLAKSVTVSDGGTTVTAATYGPPAGIPVVTGLGPRSGGIGGGTDVLIDGVNFQAPATVTFGGVSAASVTVETASRIIARSPPSLSYRTVPLTVTTAGGSATVSNGFTYIEPRGANLDLVGQIGGAVRAAAVQGTFLYTGEGSGIVIYNITNPASATPVGRLALPDMVNDIAVFGDNIYVADGAAGVFVVNVSTPAAPAVVGFFDTPGTANGVVVQNGLAYVAAGGAGLQILDCTNPAAVVLRGSVFAGGDNRRIALMARGSELYACIASPNVGLHTFNVTVPAAPTLTSTFTTVGNTRDVAVVGSKAYVATSTNGTTFNVVDLSNPAAPAALPRYDSGPATAIAVRNNIAYASVGVGFIAVSVAGTTPQHLGAIASGLPHAEKIVLSGNHAFVAAGEFGLRVMSIASTSSMSQVANVPVIASVVDVQADGTNVYAACGYSGFCVVDATSLASLRYTGRLEFPDLHSRTLAKVGSHVYLANADAGGAGLAVIRVDQATPQLASTYTQYVPRGLSSADNFLYVADSNTSISPSKARFTVLNLTSAPTLSLTGQITNQDGGFRAYHAIGAGTRAYFSDSAGVHVVDAARSSSPQRRGSVAISGEPYAIAIANGGKHLVVANGAVETGLGWTGGASIIDVQTPDAPTFVRNLFPGARVEDVEVVGNLAYLACFSRGVYVFDISDVQNPIQRAFYDTGGSAKSLSVQGDTVFVGDQSGGLLALRLLDFTPPAVQIDVPNPVTTISTTAGTLGVSGSVSDDRNFTPSVIWANDRGGGGTATGEFSWQVSALPLQPGLNRLRFSATDAAGNVGTAELTVNYLVPDTLAPTVGITFPSGARQLTVNHPTIELRGTASDNHSVSSVTWINNRGGTGSATGTSAWTAASIPLEEGPNTVTIAATDAAGNTSTVALSVTYLPPDLVPPSTVITFPTINSSYRTTDATIALSGSATDNRAVVRVRWSNDRGSSGTADGTVLWSINHVTVSPGLTVFTVTAEDDAGNSAQDTLAVTYEPPQRPTITLPPAARSVVMGQSAVFTAQSSGTPQPGWQWQRSINGGASWMNLANDGTYSGAYTATLTIVGATPPMNGDLFRAVATNGVPTDAISDGAALTVLVPPSITVPPAGQSVAAGATVTLSVSAAGTAPFSYQWRKAGVAREGANASTLTIGNAQPNDSGPYDVVVSNGVNPSATSETVTVNVVPIGTTASHSTAQPLPLGGGTITIANEFAYVGPVAQLRWSVLLPAGLSLASTDATGTDLQPSPGSIDVLEWNWAPPPASPVRFTYRVAIPPNDGHARVLAAQARFTYDGTAIATVARPDPLIVASRHSADTDRDGTISLFELTRVIELYNTRNGTVRTGAYRVDAANLEDGFGADLPRAPGATAVLTRYHSADTRGPLTGSPRDGAIDLFELTRVIELYNTRAGTVRTGQYHVQGGTEDGFAAGP